MKPKVPGEIVTALLAKFPDAASRTIARIAYRDNPGVWPHPDAARFMVRYYRGACGDKRRKAVSTKEFMRQCRQSADPFGKLPEGRDPFDSPWGPVIIPGPAKALILYDVHLPFHDRTALLSGIRHGHKLGCNLIVLCGDTLDCHAISKFEPDPRKRDFAGEVEVTKQFLSAVRQRWPKARIVFKHGNHEERYERYMFCKAPELLDVADFELSSILGLDNLGIEEVREKRPIRLGHLNLLHGHEYRFAISNPVNAARGLFLRCKAYAMCGHFHQRSHHSEKTVEGKQVATWSIGCLCQLHQEYAPLNNWSHGFAVVDVEKSGKFEVLAPYIGDGGRIF